jgi:spermidine synthase
MSVSELIDTKEEEGATLELHRRGEAYEVRVDGRRMVASDQRRCEQPLVELALAPLRQRDDLAVLVAGLGMGYTVRAVLDSPGVKRVDVVEGSPAMLEWAKVHFAQLSGDVLNDPRVKLHAMELDAFNKAFRLGALQNVPPEGWLALVLDVDQGPSSLLRPSNLKFYEERGLESLEQMLRPGGVLALWSTQRETELMRRLAARLQNVAEVATPVEVDGNMNLDYVYRARRPAPPQDPTKSN